MALGVSRSRLSLGLLALFVSAAMIQAVSAGQREDREERRRREEERRRREEEERRRRAAGCKGDPHFTGADASHFDFSGIPNTTFCLISDPHLHLNALFGGRYGEYEGNPHKSLTWMRKVGILWGHHSILFEAREGASSSYDNGYMANIEVDAEVIPLSQPGDSVTLADGAIQISWLSAHERSGDDEIDVYSVDIKGVLSMVMELRPEVPNMRTETDGTIHFDLFFPATYLSTSAHGILGQTFRPDHKDRVKSVELKYNQNLNADVVVGDNGEGYLDGSPEDYKTSDILAADCKVARFSRSEALDEETALAIELSSGGIPSVLSESGSNKAVMKSSSTYRRLKRMRLMRKMKLLKKMRKMM